MMALVGSKSKTDVIESLTMAFNKVGITWFRDVVYSWIWVDMYSMI